MDNLTERDWRPLPEAINRGNGVLLSGADVVFDPEDPDRTPLKCILARKLAESFTPNSPAVIRDDPGRAASAKRESKLGTH